MAKRRKAAKLFAGGVGIIVLLVASFAAYVSLTWSRTYDAPYPAIEASSDPEIIEQGAYLAYGPAHCVSCHTPREQWDQVVAGERVPMIGGGLFDIPPGKFYTPNLTPDPETGIGRYTDGEIARILRYSVKPDGMVAFPFMEFHDMSDEDLIAVISFLRSQEPVRNEVPTHQLNFMGKAITSLVIRPMGPNGDPPKTTPAPEPTIERGAYIANNVANCAGCHSKRNMLDGSYEGPRFAGGMEMESDENPNLVYVTPNLTPDPTTGVMAAWSEDQFLARFAQGRLHADSHMPWEAFRMMSDDDLRAIYRYIMSLEPVENFTGPVVKASKG